MMGGNTDFDVWKVLSGTSCNGERKRFSKRYFHRVMWREVLINTNCYRLILDVSGSKNRPASQSLSQVM